MNEQLITVYEYNVFVPKINKGENSLRLYQNDIKFHYYSYLAEVDRTEHKAFIIGYDKSYGYVWLDDTRTIHYEIIKERNKMLSKEEIKKWLLENCVDEDGDLNLSHLDFSDFNGDIYTCFMKVKKNLCQNYQKVEGKLEQSHQVVRKNLSQWDQIVGENLLQTDQIVGGSLFQSNQKVKGDLLQDSQKVKGCLFQGKNDCHYAFDFDKKDEDDLDEINLCKELDEELKEKLAKIYFKKKFYLVKSEAEGVFFNNCDEAILTEEKEYKEYDAAFDNYEEAKKFCNFKNNELKTKKEEQNK